MAPNALPTFNNTPPIHLQPSQTPSFTPLVLHAPLSIPKLHPIIFTITSIMIITVMIIFFDISIIVTITQPCHKHPHNNDDYNRGHLLPTVILVPSS